MKKCLAFGFLAGIASIVFSSPLVSQQSPAAPDMTFPQGSGAIRAMKLQPKLDGKIGKFEWTQFFGKQLEGGPAFAGSPLPPMMGTPAAAQPTPNVTPASGAQPAPLTGHLPDTKVPPGGYGATTAGSTSGTATAGTATTGMNTTGMGTAGAATSGKTTSSTSGSTGETTTASGTGTTASGTGTTAATGATGSSIPTTGTSNNGSGSSTGSGQPIEGKIGPAQPLGGKKDSSGNGNGSSQVSSGRTTTSGSPSASTTGNGSTGGTTGTTTTSGTTGGTTGAATGGITGSGTTSGADGKAATSGNTGTQQVPPVIPIETIPATTHGASMAGQIDSQETGKVGSESEVQFIGSAQPISAGFVSWTPGTVNVAAVIANGDDLVVSIDGKGDGRPFGSDADDYEVRISPTTHMVTVRQDNHSQFSEAVGWAGSVKFATAPCSDPTMGASLVVEATIADPTGEVLPEKDGDFVSVRLDGVSPSEITAPNQQRALTLIRCESSVGPNGGADAQVGGAPIVTLSGPKAAVPGESSNLTLNLSRLPDSFSSGATFTIDGVGVDEGDLAFLSAALPASDSSGSIRIPYSTFTAANSSLGMGALHFGITDSAGHNYDYLFPYAITDWVTIESESKTLYGVNKPLQVDLKANIISNDRMRLQGNFEVVLPDGWKTVKGNDKQFIIYNQGGVSKRSFSILVPPGVKGSFEITLKCVFPTKTIEKVVHVIIL